MESTRSVGEVFSAFVADLTGHPLHELPSPDESGAEWLGVLRQWLARLDFGLVSIANPERFSWPGHWIGLVDATGDGAQQAAVLLFGTPSAVIASPAAPSLVGKAVDELRFHQALLLVPFQPFRTADERTDRTVGEIVGIYVSEAKTEPMQSLTTATVLKGKGLAGDRYASKAGTFTPDSVRLRGYDLTLIESEAIERLTLTDGSNIDPGDARRNLVTRGIDLNALVGRELTIGSVRVFGQRLAEPCVHLQWLTRPGIIAGLVHQGGLRADVLTDGEIRLGDKIEGAS